MNTLFSEPFSQNTLLNMVPHSRLNEIKDYLESRNSDIQIAIENVFDNDVGTIWFSLHVFDENYKNNVAPFDLMEFFHKTFFNKRFDENTQFSLTTSSYETFVYFSGFVETPDDSSLVEKFASFLKNTLDESIKSL